MCDGNCNPKDRRLPGHEDGQMPPKGKQRREGVEYGCGREECRLCYEDAKPDGRAS